MEPTEKQHLVDARPGARSYTGSLWQEGTGWIPLPPSGLDLQAIELVTENNHYCHAQKGPGSHFDPKKERARRQLYVASAICLVFMIGEVVGGYLAHSLAVMTDAAHLLTDFASMLVSLFSLWMSSRPATKTMNFGWQRAEILGALLSVLSIWVVTGVLVFLAVERLISGDYEIEGGTMLITSGCAVAVNIMDPQGCGLHSRSGSAAVGGRRGSLAQPAHLGLDRGPARAVGPHRHRARVSKSLSGASPGVSSRPLAQNADGQAVLKAASTRLQGKFHFHTMTIQIEDYSEDMKDCQACQGPSD
ncbi:zinc transporter 2 isoform X3 [Leptonychotes weddellii]|uniref:Zinc transporter 2 isoform X3 n=1 Tax=Leptonychotes weddellii TaxID=9713 RepID=A0A7F8Q4A9_LEPWE|nr:zinc transporter 2 isoform X3 [Leptonychotes weddellii]